MTPLKNQFQISLTVRENERENLLQDKETEIHKEQLQNAKKYSEGYAMRFLVTDKATFKNTKKFINKIIAIRK